MIYRQGVVAKANFSVEPQTAAKEWLHTADSAVKTKKVDFIMPLICIFAKWYALKVDVIT